jgi:hypothetical protein
MDLDPLLMDEGVMALKPGDQHYKAFIGPPEEYDLVAAMVFNLLTTLGLRATHKVLDIGCGSLRIGRLLIPYLNSGNYYGIEPNEWLVKDGIAHEIGQDMIDLKQPILIYADRMDQVSSNTKFDYMFAQSIFSHASKSVIQQWLAGVTSHLSDEGLFLATYLRHSQDYRGLRGDWVYPDCVYYQDETLRRIAAAFDLHFQPIAWAHPRQIWGAFYFDGYDVDQLDSQMLNWNAYVATNFDVRYPPSEDFGTDQSEVIH